MNFPEPGSARFKAAESTQELVRKGAAVSRAETTEERTILCREAASLALIVAEAWKLAAAAAQQEYERERQESL